MADTVEKDLQLVEEALADIVSRMDRFAKAIEDGDIKTIVSVYAEEACAHMSLLPDIVKDADVQLAVLENTTVTSCMIKEVVESIR